MLPLAPETYVDVLVIGAGPAGLMCGNALAAAGGLDNYGLGERLLREGNQMHTCAFYNPNDVGEIELTSRAPDVTAPTARFPFEVTLHQGAIEQMFLDSMAAHNLRVDRPVKPVAIELSRDPEELHNLSSYPVKVTLARLDAITDTNRLEVVRAKYVVGADGAHSWVRKAFGITMEGEQTEYVWGVVDIVHQ
ncbi:hypothetical protein EDD15DRAFT_2164931 [Pisolithus albus]|nr:hypothetical protein EDD15DRAFT_2164931 [Pisolithus albus]